MPLIVSQGGPCKRFALDQGLRPCMVTQRVTILCEAQAGMGGGLSSKASKTDQTPSKSVYSFGFYIVK